MAGLVARQRVGADGEVVADVRQALGRSAHVQRSVTVGVARVDVAGEEGKEEDLCP